MYKLDTKKWTVVRAVYLLAGIFVTAGVVLGLMVHRYFFYFTAFVGVMLINFAITGLCPSAMILDALGVGRENEKLKMKNGK